MAADKDWKAKYKAIVDELEGKEAEWQESDTLLRKTISRLSIAGRGIDSRLDDQLKSIQSLARDKQDNKLADALEALSRVVASMDDGSDKAASTQEIQKPVIDPSSLLLALLQEVQFKDEQRAELKSICGDLLKLLGSGKNQNVVKPQIQKLSALINQNFGGDNTPVSDKNNSPEGISATDVLTTLLEKLTVVQGANETGQLLQTEVLDKVEDCEWTETISQIVDCISATMNKLNREKHDLEDFIVKITQQLGKISEVIAADQKDHQSDRDDRDSLQKLMRESMNSIESDIDNVSEIGQLKNVVTKNLLQIQNGIEGFVTRANQRQEVIDERNDHLVAQIAAMDKKTRQLKKKLNENREKLLFDTLTGAGSRLSYDEQLEQELARWQRYGENFSYVILDIDHFKKINDKYGHSAGDKALKIVAKMMMSQIRKSDSIYRIGGEEFVLLLPSTTVDKAESLVNKLRTTIANSSIHCKQERVVLTLSAGLTEPRSDDIAKTLYERADKALYRAKNAGRNCQFAA